VWYPKEKIRQAKKKLQGYNPAHVMLTELTLGHEKTAEYPALKIILMGDKKYSKRAQVSTTVVIRGHPGNFYTKMYVAIFSSF
jgi:hypothetical protein